MFKKRWSEWFQRIILFSLSFLQYLLIRYAEKIDQFFFPGKQKQPTWKPVEMELSNFKKIEESLFLYHDDYIKLQ